MEAAYVLAREGCEPWLFNHIVRSWLYSVRLAQTRSLSSDQELLALALAVLRHDLGRTQNSAVDRRFEVAGADQARDFALQHGLGERRAEIVRDAVALHTTPSIAHLG